MTRRDPWRDLFVVPREVTQFFNPGLTLTGAREQVSTAYLPLDIRQTESEFVLEASVPGFQVEDIDVVAEKGTLTIRGERKTEAEVEGRYLRRERRQSSFVRQLTLPAEIRESEITASFVNGVLTVHVPRVEAPAPTRIKIEVGAEAPALGASAASVAA